MKNNRLNKFVPRLPKNRWSRIMLAVVPVLLVFIFVGNTIAAGIIENVVQDRFVILNAKETQVWSMEDIDVDMFAGTLRIRHVQIEPDSTYFHNYLAGNTPNANLVSLGVSDVLLRGINVFDIFVKQYLNLKEIHIQGLTVTVHHRPAIPAVGTDSVSVRDSTSQTLVVPGLKNIDLNEIIVEQLNFIMVDAETNKPIETYHGEKMQIDGLSLDPAGVLKGFFEINRENLRIHLEQQRINLSAANYAMYFDSMDLLVRDGDLIFTGLQIKPTSDKYELATSSRYKRDVFELDLPRLQLSGIRVDDALYRGKIVMDSVVIDSFRIAINTDINRPRDLNRVPDFPNQLLKKAKVPLHIGKIHFKDGGLQYQEFRGNLASIDISLENLDLTIQNIKSGTMENADEGSMLIGIHGTALKDAAFRIDLDFPYTDPYFGFRYTGHVGPFNMTHLNTLLLASNIDIAEGRATNISYTTHCNTLACAGDFTMEYTGLKIAIEKNRVQKTNRKLSLLANTLLKSNNPHNGRLKSVKVKAERISNSGLPQLLVGTLKNGARQTLTP